MISDPEVITGAGSEGHRCPPALAVLQGRAGLPLQARREHLRSLCPQSKRILPQKVAGSIRMPSPKRKGGGLLCFLGELMTAPVVPSVMGTQYPLASVGVIGTWGISRATGQADNEAESVKRYLFLSDLYCSLTV